MIRYFFLSIILIIFSITIHTHQLNGKASWYGPKFHGNKTANGEIFDMYSISAAHKTLPLGTYVKVENLDNNKTIRVRINDRGPFVKNRIIDLSYGAAKEIGLVNKGTANVRLTILKFGDNKYKKNVKSELNIKKYYIQIASFSNKKRALKMKNKLSKKFKMVFIYKSKFYKVLIGPFTSKAEAKKGLKIVKYYKYNGYIINGIINNK